MDRPSSPRQLPVAAFSEALADKQFGVASDKELVTYIYRRVLEDGFGGIPTVLEVHTPVESTAS